MVTQVKNGLMSEKEYTDKYFALMRQSYRDHRDIWEEVLNREEVVFVCFCKSGKFCHRYLLANIFVRLGAKYMGEI